ncbi:DoxX-like family protein [Virgibacillus sp. M23]|uniref:DoxX-like family protein n=2 Tax=unclassified Virgibacillus TaxID=2620237 RepID=UPI002A91C924|nr:DoxX-like family protein [Virgibacillus sp. M23]MDY7045464.1 DoxX-like family protein [Virgibacillus sp. M23]
MKNKPIYVEIPIQSDTETIWKFTQTPDLHEKWDLRFSSISYLPKDEVKQQQKFSYKSRIGFGLQIKGWGRSSGSSNTKDGSKVSSLQFGSDQTVSIIKEGGGYWKYIPQQDSTLFLTKYNYKTRFGYLGKLFDFFIFRPLMGWATAISFAVLKRWIEEGEMPTTQYLRFFSSWLFALLFSFIWLYHGLAAKLIHQHPVELSMVQTALSINVKQASVLIMITGAIEVMFGLMWLFYENRRWLYIIQIAIFPLLGIIAILTTPDQLFHPFNPVTFNLALLVVSIVGLHTTKNIPTARSCKRK